MSDTKPTPRSVSSRSVTTRSGSDRPQRSSRQTTTTSTSRRRAAFNNDSRPGRSFAPEPTSSTCLATCPATVLDIRPSSPRPGGRGSAGRASRPGRKVRRAWAGPPWPKTPAESARSNPLFHRAPETRPGGGRLSILFGRVRPPRSHDLITRGGSRERVEHGSPVTSRCRLHSRARTLRRASAATIDPAEARPGDREEGSEAAPARRADRRTGRARDAGNSTPR